MSYRGVPLVVPRRSVQPEALSDAARTAGSSFVTIIDSAVAGLGAATTRFLRPDTVLAPYAGRILLAAPLVTENRYVVEARPARGSSAPLYWVDASVSSHRSDAFDPPLTAVEAAGRQFTVAEQWTNWTRYINSVDPREPARQNVEYRYIDPALDQWPVVERAGVYVVTTRTVVAGEELLANYGVAYFYADMADVQVRDDTALSDEALLDVLAATSRDSHERRLYEEQRLRELVAFRQIGARYYLFEEVRQRRVLGVLGLIESTIILAVIVEMMNERDILDRMIEHARATAVAWGARTLRTRRFLFADDQWFRDRYAFHVADDDDGVEMLESDLAPLQFVDISDEFVEALREADATGTSDVDEVIRLRRMCLTYQVFDPYEANIVVTWCNEALAVFRVHTDDDAGDTRLMFVCLLANLPVNTRQFRDFVLRSIVNYYEQMAVWRRSSRFTVYAEPGTNSEGDRQRSIALAMGYSRARMRRDVPTEWNYELFTKRRT